MLGIVLGSHWGLVDVMAVKVLLLLQVLLLLLLLHPAGTSDHVRLVGLVGLRPVHRIKRPVNRRRCVEYMSPGRSIVHVHGGHVRVTSGPERPSIGESRRCRRRRHRVAKKVGGARHEGSHLLLLWCIQKLGRWLVLRAVALVTLHGGSFELGCNSASAFLRRWWWSGGLTLGGRRLSCTRRVPSGSRNAAACLFRRSSNLGATKSCRLSTGVV